MEKTLAEARSELNQLLRVGATCPCCGQFAKIYKRKLNSNMAYALTVIYRRSPRESFHMPTLLSSVRKQFGGDPAKLRYWELIEEVDTSTYKLTEKGNRFVLGEITVPKYIYIYNDFILNADELGDMYVDSSTTSIKEALGSHFNYHELMTA